MKYFTKEWYELCQKTNAHLLLEEDKEAESFSEKYFQKVYNEKLTEWLDLQERYITHEAFDREKLSRQFHEMFIYNQEYTKKILPEEILRKIADIRVYVFDKASNEVIKDVTRFCQHNEKLVKRTVEEYGQYCKKTFKSFDRNVVKNINFHDCIIIDIKETEQGLSILFDNSGGFTNINEMQLENYNIIKQDALLQNSWWLYDEIYKINSKYELHVLLQNLNGDLIEFIVSAEYIYFKHN